MAAVVLAVEVAMEPAMLARGRVGRVESTMLGSQIVVKIAMGPAIAVAVPGPMLAPMLTALLAMKSPMLAAVRIGRVKAAMLLPQVAVEAAVATGRLVDMLLTALLRNGLLARFGARAPIGALFDLRALGALGTLGAFGTFSAPRRAGVTALLARHALRLVIARAASVLRDRRHRRAGRKKDRYNQSTHHLTPDDNSSLITAYLDLLDERMLNKIIAPGVEVSTADAARGAPPSRPARPP